jgi:ankyrin repeat protein
MNKFIFFSIMTCIASIYHQAKSAHFNYSYSQIKDIEQELLKSKPSYKMMTEITKETPLHIAVAQNNIEAAKELINLGVNLEAKDFCGKTPLIRAIDKSDSTIPNTTNAINHSLIELLLNAEADVNAQSNDGNSPIFYAIMPHINDGQVMQLLVIHGADLNVQNNHHETPRFLGLDNSTFKAIAKRRDMQNSLKFINDRHRKGNLSMERYAFLYESLIFDKLSFQIFSCYTKFCYRFFHFFQKCICTCLMLQK